LIFYVDGNFLFSLMLAVLFIEIIKLTGAFLNFLYIYVYMKDIINETFKKHLKLLHGRLNENFEEEGDNKVDKFIKNAVMADSQMALMKNRDNLILIVKTFMEATGNKPYSDRAVEMYIDRVAGSSSGYVSRLENPDIVVPGLGGKKDTQIDPDMAHLDDYDAEVEARKRLGYKGREEDDFKDVQKYVYGVKKEGI